MENISNGSHIPIIDQILFERKNRLEKKFLNSKAPAFEMIKKREKI